VSSLATPPFDVPDFPLPTDLPLDPGTIDPGTSDFTAPEFGTPLPEIPPADEDSALGDVEEAGSPFDGAIPALLVLAALALSPLFGLGSTRLADNVLAPVSTGCPTGHDKPPPARPT
jgi:hypothetical protein